MFIDLNTKMPEGKRVCTRMKAVLLIRMYDYFDSLEQHGGGRGELSRPLEATDIKLHTVSCVLEGTFTASTYM